MFISRYWPGSHLRQLVVFVAIALVPLFAAPASAATDHGYRMPWAAGETWVVTSTAHDGAYDFDINTGDNTPRVLAVGAGKARVACSDGAGQTTVVLETHLGHTFRYVHLSAGSVSEAGITESWTEVPQGRVLGRLRDSVPTSNTGCGYGNGNAHLHLKFPEFPFVLDGVTFHGNDHRGSSFGSSNQPTTEGPSEPGNALNVEPVLHGSPSSWYHGDGYRYTFSVGASAPRDNWADWGWDVAAGTWRIDCLVPPRDAGANAKYEITHPGGATEVSFDQTHVTGWRTLTDVAFSTRGVVRVVTGDNVDPAGEPLGVDTCRLVQIAEAPPSSAPTEAGSVAPELHGPPNYWNQASFDPGGPYSYTYSVGAAGPRDNYAVWRSQLPPSTYRVECFIPHRNSVGNAHYEVSWPGGSAVETRRQADLYGWTHLRDITLPDGGLAQIVMGDDTDPAGEKLGVDECKFTIIADQPADPPATGEFSGSPNGQLFILEDAVTMAICSDSQVGRQVTVRLEVDGVARPDVTLPSPGRCVEFRDLDGPGLDPNATFTARAALDGPPDDAWNGSACFDDTGGRGMCQRVHGSDIRRTPDLLAFDTISAPPMALMDAWREHSPYTGVGVYLTVPGEYDNRGDKVQAHLTADWVAHVRADGWSLLPIFVGRQAPRACREGNFHRISTDPSTARAQGVTAARDAAAAMAGLGINDPAAPVYLDIEPYRPGCEDEISAYIGGWTSGLHEAGLTAGVYGSRGTLGVQLQNATTNLPDAVWLATSNLAASADGLDGIDDSTFAGARTNQYHLDVTRTWGGHTLRIDENAVDGPVVQPANDGEAQQPEEQSGTETDRLAGPGRRETSVLIATHAFPTGAPVVYLAEEGAGLAEALAATGSLTDGPVLLTNGTGTPAQTVLDGIAALSPDTVIALGPAAGGVSDTMLDALAQGRTTDRIGGADLFEVAARIAVRAFPEGADTVYVAEPAKLADGLAGGTVTAGPIILVPADGYLPGAVGDAIRMLDPTQVTALGGPAAVSDDVLGQAASGGRQPGRIFGPSRFETATEISRAVFVDGAPTVYLARADIAPDAVVAGSVTDGPILLVESCSGVHPSTASEIRRLQPTRIIALGGTAAICDQTLTTAVAR